MAKTSMRVKVYNANGKNGIDNAGISSLALDLSNAPRTVQRRAQAFVKRGAVNIKKDARTAIERAQAQNSSIKHYPYTIDFDVKAGGLEATIGPNPRVNEQARMGNILEYGSMFNAPIPHLQPALEAEAPRFADALARASADIL